MRFFEWHILHRLYKFLIRAENPPQQTNKKKEEDNERNHWPDGDVVDTLKDVFIHIVTVIQLVLCSFLSLYVFA